VTAGSGGGSQLPRGEIVDFGSAHARGAAWLPRLLLASLVVTAVILVVSHPGNRHARTIPQVTVTTVGHPILGVRADWVLFALTNANEVVSIRFARGVITRTALPQPESAGLVSFVVGPRDVMVRPLNNVHGYLVPDGQPPRPLTGLLASRGILLPGPAPGQEWFADGVHTVTLVGPAGQGTSVSITAAAQRWPAQTAMADGRGDVLLFNDAGVLYDVGPSLLRRVGMRLAAVGPHNWLGIDCARGGCHNVVIDVATGATRALPGVALTIVNWPWPAQPGVVAPNGAYAAVTVTPGGTGAALALVDLRAGAVTTVPVAIGSFSSSQTLAWSPDSRWLFVITATGGLVAVDPADRSVRSPGVRLTNLSQIAVRAASS
jgi:hypothetical protein